MVESNEENPQVQFSKDLKKILLTSKQELNFKGDFDVLDYCGEQDEI